MTRKMLLFTILSLSLAGVLGTQRAGSGPTQARTDRRHWHQRLRPIFQEPTRELLMRRAGLTGDTTLTINGNEFTTADGKTGRIVASTTGGYTAVALQMSGTDPRLRRL